MNERLNELETQLAFQENTINSLNEVMARQQQQIEVLEQQVRQLAGQIEQLADAMARPSADEPPPPHY